MGDDIKWDDYFASEWELDCGKGKIWNLAKAFTNAPWVSSNATRTIGAMVPGLLCAYSIDTALEIGIANAFLTCLLGRGLAAANNGTGLLVTCDLNENCCRMAKSKQKFTPDVKLVIVNKDSTKVNWGDYLEGRQVGFASIDGDHSYEVVKKDIENVVPYIKIGGFMFCHDYGQAQLGVVHAVNEFLELNPEWTQIILPQRTNHGDYSATFLQRVGDLKSFWWDK